MRKDARKAFTLVEMLIVIIVIGILAGLMMISSGSATDKAEETRCVADRRSIRSALNIYRAEHGAITSADIKTALEYVLKNNFDNTRGKVEDNNTVTGICPAKGRYTATVSDDRITMTCSVHDDIGLNEASVFDFSKKLVLNATAEYFINEKNKDKIKFALNSEGVSYGQSITQDLSAALGIDMSQYLWRIYVNKEKKTYEIYWTEKTTKTTNVTAYKVTYNYENKSFSNVATGTVSIGTETEKDKDGNEHTYKIIDGNSFK